MYCNRTQIKIKKGKKSESRIKMIRNENNFEATVKNAVFFIVGTGGCTLYSIPCLQILFGRTNDSSTLRENTFTREYL